jgi:hypothetical protein
MAAAAVPGQHATTIAQRYQYCALPEHPAGLLAILIQGIFEWVDALPLTMPHNATRLDSSQLWTTPTPDIALRRMGRCHFDEVCDTGQLTLAKFDTWHQDFLGIPFTQYNTSDSLIWDLALHMFVRCADPAIPGNVFLVPSPSVEIFMLSATADGSPQRFQYGPPQLVLHGASYPPSLPLPGNAPPPAPLRYFDAAYGAPVHFNYAAQPSILSPFPPGINVQGQAANPIVHGCYGPTMHPILHNMINDGGYFPFHRHRMLTGACCISHPRPLTLFHSKQVHYY